MPQNLEQAIESPTYQWHNWMGVCVRVAGMLEMYNKCTKQNITKS